MSKKDGPVEKDTPVYIYADLYNHIKEFVKKDRIRYGGGVKQFVNETLREKLIELGILEPTVAVAKAEVEG